jgi:transcriptional regulator with XRE-family HTH domain
MDSDFKGRLGERIRDLRLLRGLSQKELGDACQVSQPTISDVESGSAGLRMSTAERIAVALGVTVAELLSGIDEKRRKRKAV